MLYGAFFVVVLFLTAAWEAVFAVPLWRWFVVPVTGWPELSWLSAVGLTATLSVMLPHHVPIDGFHDKEQKEQADAKSGMDPLARSWAQVKHESRVVGLRLLIPPAMWMVGCISLYLQGKA